MFQLIIAVVRRLWTSVPLALPVSLKIASDRSTLSEPVAHKKCQLNNVPRRGTISPLVRRARFENHDPLLAQEIAETIIDMRKELNLEGAKRRGFDAGGERSPRA